MIAVTGAGIISAIGKNKQQTLNALLEERSGIDEMKILDSVHRELPVGEVKMTNQEMCDKLGIKDSLISRTSLMGIIAIKEALNDAGKFMDGDKVALISGTTVGGMDQTERYYPNYDSGYLNVHFCGSSTDAMAEYFSGLFDFVSTTSTACSAAANSIILGARMIEHGLIDVAVVGGSESLSKYHLNGFNSLMILDHAPCKPFDKNRNGLNLGEGAAFIVLESEEHAKKRNAKPMGFLKGWGNRCDAFHQTATSENGEGAYLAMSDALRKADMQPRDIQYINAHGTATQNNDASEVNAIKRVFGESLPKVSSTKSFTGHTTSASGSIEAVICLLALQHGFIPANLNLEESLDETFTPVKHTESTQITNILSNAFGFGGNDSSLIFSRLGGNQKACVAGPRKVNVVCTVDDFSSIDLAQYISPLRSRRMDKMLKASLAVSFEALRIAGIQCPDAIFAATAYGCMGNTDKFLKEMLENGEEEMSPTAFMQSTHNTIGSTVAIETKCHGYNITYSHLQDSENWALLDACMQLQKGVISNALVLVSDMLPDNWREWMDESSSLPSSKNVKAIVLSNENGTGESVSVDSILSKLVKKV